MARPPPPPPRPPLPSPPRPRVRVSPSCSWIAAPQPPPRPPKEEDEEAGDRKTQNAEEVGEMAHGLASTGRPFLWVVRPDTRPLLPEGFLDSVAGRGTVVLWSPQDRVLAHPATACFLMHCGWNSTLETIVAGVPVVAFPQWGDQCTDAKFLVDELRMGVRLRGPLRRDAVREAVDAAVAGPEADEMLASARRWSAAARDAVALGGSSDALTRMSRRSWTRCPRELRSCRRRQRSFSSHQSHQCWSAGLVCSPLGVRKGWVLGIYY